MALLAGDVQRKGARVIGLRLVHVGAVREQRHHVFGAPAPRRGDQRRVEARLGGPPTSCISESGGCAAAARAAARAARRPSPRARRLGRRERRLGRASNAPSSCAGGARSLDRPAAARPPRARLDLAEQLQRLAASLHARRAAHLRRQRRRSGRAAPASGDARRATSSADGLSPTRKLLEVGKSPSGSSSGSRPRRGFVRHLGNECLVVVRLGCHLASSARRRRSASDVGRRRCELAPPDARCALFGCRATPTTRGTAMRSGMLLLKGGTLSTRPPTGGALRTFVHVASTSLGDHTTLHFSESPVRLSRLELTRTLARSPLTASVAPRSLVSRCVASGSRASRSSRRATRASPCSWAPAASASCWRTTRAPSRC